MQLQPRAPLRRCLPALAIALVVAAGSASAQPRPAPLPDLPVSRLERQPVIQAPALPATQLAERAGLDARSLTLTFPRPLPIRDVLIVLVRDTPYSIVADAEVGGTFVGELRSLTMRHALEAVLFPAGLDYAVSGTVIRVFPRRAETRMFEVDLVAVRRSWQRSVGADAEFTAAVASDAFAELDAGVRALLSPIGRHHVDRRAGLVQVTDYADRLDQIGVYLERAQLRAARQIRLDVRMLRIIPTRAALPGGPQVARRSAGVLVDDLEAFLRGLETEGEVLTLAAPQLVTMNNEPALLRVQTGGEGAAAVGAGLTLVVTPSISADAVVQLNISPRYTDAAIGSFAPAEPPTTSEADMIVRVRAGQTVVLSGMPGRPLDPGVPVAPRAARAELILLVTPALVTLTPQPAAAAARPEEP